MRLRSFLSSIAVSVALSGCAHPTAPAAPPSSDGSLVAPALTGDPAHPGRTSGWVDTRLYFGLGPADQPQQLVSEAQWRDFLDKELTPRFPGGLSVVDVYGQWQGPKGPAPERLRSKLLIVDYEDSEENRDKVEAIRSVWKRNTGDLSVLCVTQPADVSFGASLVSSISGEFRAKKRARARDACLPIWRRGKPECL